MPARTGQQYIDELNERPIRVEIEGKSYTGGTADLPQFRNVVRSYAELYDLQHEQALIDTLTYPSPKTGDRVGTSFLQPANAEELLKRREMMQVWARYSNGVLGRTGDYLNSAVMALASAKDRLTRASATTSLPTTSTCASTICC
jgi:4-hydroxyphenylacetate 3-monooxygenase